MVGALLVGLVLRLIRLGAAPLWFVHNTVVSLRSGSTTLLQLSAPGQHAECRGNVVSTTAPGRSLAVFGGEGTVALRDNWLPAGWRETLSPGRGRVVVAAAGPAGDDPGFVGRAAGDYRLAPGSPCAGRASPLPPDAFPGGLPEAARPAADVAGVPLDGGGRFTDLGARIVPVETPAPPAPHPDAGAGR